MQSTSRESTKQTQWNPDLIMEKGKKGGKVDISLTDVLPHGITMIHGAQTMVSVLQSLEWQCSHMLMQARPSKRTWEVGNSREWSAPQHQLAHAMFVHGAVRQQELWDHELYLPNLRNLYTENFSKFQESRQNIKDSWSIYIVCFCIPPTSIVSNFVLQLWQPVHMASHYPKSQVLQFDRCDLQANRQNATLPEISPCQISHLHCQG